MGLFDLNKEELKKYQGRNPKPADFDEYWQRALDEMNAVKPDVSLIPAYDHPNIACYDLTFTGTDGARIYAKYALPKRREGKIPAVFQFHGYTGSSGDWSGLFSIAASGFAAVALDARGQGGKSEDAGGVKGNTMNGQIIRGLEDEDPDRLLFRHIFLDTALLVRIVSGFEEIDASRLAACGGSQGGGLALACASLAPIKLTAVCYPFLCDYRRVWEMDLAVAAYAELKEFFRHTDPRHEREEEIFTKLGYIDVQHLADRIRGKVKMFTGLMDTICPPSSQMAAFNKIKTEKEVIFYPDFGHEWLPDYSDKMLSWFCEEL